MTNVVQLNRLNVKTACDVIDRAQSECAKGVISDYHKVVVIHMTPDGKNFGFIQNGMSATEIVGMLEMAKLFIHRQSLVSEA